MPEEPRNSLRPSGKVRSRPLARWLPSFDWYPSTMISVPASSESVVKPRRKTRRAYGFDCPVHRRAVGVLHVYMQPCVESRGGRMAGRGGVGAPCVRGGIRRRQASPREDEGSRGISTADVNYCSGSSRTAVDAKSAVLSFVAGSGPLRSANASSSTLRPWSKPGRP